MKNFAWIFTCFGVLAIAFIIACENYDDPFSAKNVAPGITDFRFKRDPSLPTTIPDDSLKFRAGTTYLLHLEYRDPEFENKNRGLRATFNFLNGSGKIRHASFLQPGADSLTFADVPATFNDDLLFTPNSAATVDIELTLSDGVKESTARLNKIAKFFPNLAPIPAFSWRIVNQDNNNPYEIEFDPRSSRDRDGRIVSYQWTFDDDSAAVRLSASPFSHFYRLAGQYRARLRVVDEDGKADSTEQLITTNNQPPVAALRVLPLSGEVPLEIDYNAGGSFDPDGHVASYQVFFGDGETAQTPSGKHTYQNDANYQVLLIVKDNLGLADTAIANVRVSTPPVAVLAVTPEEGPFPLTVRIDGRGSQDPHPNGGISAYRLFINNNQLSTQDSITTELTTPGNYLVALEVDNIRGLTARTEKIVRATNLPPVADFVYAPENPQPTVDVTFTSTSSDPNTTDSITNYTWNWGDGTPVQSGSSLSSVQHEFAASPPTGWQVTLTVTDSFGLTGRKIIQLVVQ